MLTLNAADDPNGPGWQIFHYPTNAAAAQPLPVTFDSVTFNPGVVNATQTMAGMPWLRTDRMPTVPITYTIAAGGNTGMTYIFPREPR